jgi:hypothetical protein
MTPEEVKKFILGLKPDDIDKKLIDEKFTDKFDVETNKLVPREISFQTGFILKKGEYCNTTDVKTNAGQLIVNKYLFEPIPRVQKVVGYVAEPFTKKMVDKIESKMAKASNDKLIAPEDWAVYLNRIQWFGMALNTNVSPSFTPNTVRILPSVKALRSKLFKENAEAIKNGDTVTAVKIEKELLKVAQEELKDDVGMEIYDSGAKPKFGNNYKNTFVTRGPMYHPDREEFSIGDTAFMDGIKKDNLDQYGTSVVNGAYSKACNTAVAGYLVKKLYATYQGTILDKKGSDCHSKGYREFVLTPDKADKVKNRYIIEGSKLVELNLENMPKYIGKRVKMRSPMYCKGECLCNACAGNAFYNQGIKNVGLTAANIGSDFLNLLMKAFHDSTMSFISLDVNDIVID